MIEISKNLLSSLAPSEPINNDEIGGCIFCRGMPPGTEYGYSKRFLTDHTKACAWVKARKLMGDKIPKRRKSA
jgi:hypothetical protein